MGQNSSADWGVIEGRVANGAVTWVGTAWNTKLPSLGFVLSSTGFKSGLALSSLSNLALMSVCDLEILAKVVSFSELMLCMSSRCCCCCYICSCCYCCICSCCCLFCADCCLRRLSMMTTEEGLEKGLTWRETGLWPPIAPNSSLSLSCRGVGKGGFGG